MTLDDRENEQAPNLAEFDSLVVAFSEALASGLTPSPPDETVLPRELRSRLRGTQACLSLLDQARRVRQQAQSRSLAGLDLLARDPSPASLPRAGLRMGRFEVVRELGRGGYGVVFLAIDTALGRKVALKVPRPEVIVTPELSRRFLREAEAAGGLTHPNLVAVHEVGTQGSIWFIASAYCDGPNLAQWLKSRTEPVPVRQAAQLVAALADGVAEAHRHGVLHRDIKPSNVLLDSPPGPAASPSTTPCSAELIPKLTDFGLAKLLEDTQHETRSNALLGTPAYMAPEQACAKTDQIGPGTDIYGLGTVLYELLTGIVPFRGESDVQVLRAIAENDPVRPRLVRPGVPRDLEAICLQCLEKQPSHRYASAERLAADLRRFLANEPTIARPLSGLQRAHKWVRRRPALAGLIAVSATAMLMFAMLAIGYVRQQRAARLTADALRGEAEASAMTSRTHEQSANRLLYASQMRLAYEWLEQGETERVAELLDRYDAPGPLADLRGFEWFHLKRRLHGERLSLTGHDGQVNAVVFSPTGRQLASGAQSGSIRFWDPVSGQEVTNIRAHANCVNTLAYSPDGSLLASGSCDHTVKLWNVATHELLGQLEGHPDNVQCVAFSPSNGNLLASCGNDSVVNVWDLTTRQVVHRLDTKRRAVTGLAWRFDAQRLFVVAHGPLDSQSAALEWDLVNDHAIALSETSSWACAVAAHSAEFCCGMRDGTLRYFKDGAAESSNAGAHFGHVYSLAFSPDGRRIASGGDDHSIRIWDATRKVHTETLTAHTARVQSLAYSPDGLTLASGSFDGSVKLWDIAAGDHEIVTTDLCLETQRPEDIVALSADLRQLAVLHRPQTVRILDIADGSVLSDLTTAGAPSGFHFLTDRPVLFGLSLQPGAVDEWDVDQRKSVNTHLIEVAHLTALALCADGHTLVVADPGGVDLVDTAADRTFRKLNEHRPETRPHVERPRLCFSPNGRSFAISTTPADPSWIINPGQESSVSESLPEVRAISNNAELLAVRARTDLAIALVDARSQHELATLRHLTAVYHAAFSPDAKTLATICQDGTVYLWNCRTGQEITRFETRAGCGVKVQFSLDGRRLAAVTRSDPSRPAGGEPWTAHLFVWNGLASD